MKVAWGKIKKLPGWLSYIDALIINKVCATIESRVAKPGFVEIGVHHGKSFIYISKCFNISLKSVAIDIFSDQSSNLDKSGKGDREKFEFNLQSQGISKSDVSIIQKSSLEVTGNDIKNLVGNVDVFHIDGGHYFEAVMSDLRLAATCLNESGVIIIDDIWRPEWPDVTKAMYKFLEQSKDKFQVIAFGYNKVYLTEACAAASYRDSLLVDKQLKGLCFSRVQFDGYTIPVYRAFPNIEWSFRRKTKYVLATFFTQIYISMYAFFK